MKLWEVIKELTEDPTKTFELSDKGSKERIRSDGNYLCYSEIDNGMVFDDLILEDNVDVNNNNWQLVRQPVTWQEALQAWAAGKTVSGDVDGCKFKFTRDYSIFGLSKQMINIGSWYVED